MLGDGEIDFMEIVYSFHQPSQVGLTIGGHDPDGDDNTNPDPLCH